MNERERLAHGQFPHHGISVMNSRIFLALTFGDPHIRTLDGHTYTFNGVGDYILFSVKNSTEFTIHSRMSKAKVSQNSSVVQSRATVFSAFAIKTDQGAFVELYLNVTSKFIELQLKVTQPYRIC